jgi:hypothetical protein
LRGPEVVIDEPALELVAFDHLVGRESLAYVLRFFADRAARDG